jgi:outer membrane protein insertion porin family
MKLKINGLKKGKPKLLKDNGQLTKGKVVNENLITTTKNNIENKYKKDGFYNAKAVVLTYSRYNSG